MWKVISGTFTYCFTESTAHDKMNECKSDLKAGTHNDIDKKNKKQNYI